MSADAAVWVVMSHGDCGLHVPGDAGFMLCSVFMPFSPLLEVTGVFSMVMCSLSSLGRFADLDMVSETFAYMVTAACCSASFKNAP